MAADELLSVSAAAKVVRVTPATLRRWADEKRIRHIRLPSGQVRFRRSDIEAVVVPVEPDSVDGAA